MRDTLVRMDRGADPVFKRVMADALDQRGRPYLKIALGSVVVKLIIISKIEVS